MWRLLIVALIALTPLAMSHVSQKTGVPLGGWLPRAEKQAVAQRPVPPADWKESAYLAANPDVAAAVRNGLFESGYEHYQQAGLREGRNGGFTAQRAVAEVPAAR